MMKQKTILAGAIALAIAPATATADKHELPFADANIFFELNNTDGDLGIHALIDGDPWKTLEIEDTKEREILDVRLRGRLRRQGLTEFFFESAEPPFTILKPEEFFKRFPPGDYEIEGKTIEGDELESIATVTHLMPAPADGVTLNGVADGPPNGPEIAKERCDDTNLAYDPVEVAPNADGTVTIAWDEVMTSHPTIGAPNSSTDIEINNYQVVVEVEDTVLSVILPPEETSITVPAEVVAAGDAFKYEILTREESYNQTAMESCFVLL